ncbi:MAG: DNA replication/repair protein RecF [Eubacterium sp.]|nr:DNA replication/repair protein RecF [Eubacterium sp.]
MIIDSLELKDFRNYTRATFKFDSGTNVIYGDNAQGKTNILEAIYLGAMTRSHRGSKDTELIRFGQEESHIRLFFQKNSVRHKIDLHLRKNKGKGIAVDGIPIRKASELIGTLHVVFFSPEDLNIIKNGPAERRKFLNSEISQMDRIYYADLSDYSKVLQQRNQLLKDIYFKPSLMPTLDIWDRQLVSYGSKIIESRAAYIRELAEVVKDLHSRLTGGREEIAVNYEPDVEISDFSEKLSKARETDLKFHTTSVGPHRDDFKVMTNGLDVRHFGSQGQQRSAALSLKLSEIDFVEKKTDDTPILLLDDVLSELDRTRQSMLLSEIRKGQTFITCTGMDELIENNYPMNKIFHISQGSLI